MKRIVNFLLALAILAGVTACSGPADTQSELQKPTWQEQYDLGVRYLSEGNYEEAIIAFTAAIEIDPKQAPAYVGRGDAYVLSGETEDNLVAAKADYETAIELDEASAEAYLGLADVYIRQGDYDSALNVLRNGLELMGSNEELTNKIAEIKNLWNIKGTPTEITVLTKQIITENTDEWGKYSAEEISTVAYDLYQYDKQGYMIHSESWSYNYNLELGRREWIKTSSEDWIYNAQTNRWTENYERIYGPQNGSVELEQYLPGTHHYITDRSGEISITTDPYPAEKSRIVFNSSYTEKDNGFDWYSAKYTYDKDGNAILIESYSKDGKLLGTCELEYEIIAIGSDEVNN